jgi:hypothetical protein
VLLTLTGWLAIAGGLFRIFFPEAKQAGENRGTYAFITILFVIGAILTFEGYRP